MATWVTEESDFEGYGYSQSLKVLRKLHDEQTPYQHLQVFETANFGNLMVLDGVFQNTEVDEFAYHEMMSHVPLFAHDQPKRVLIVGGGDGGVAREVFKHKCVEEVHLVDIDEAVTRVAKLYFKSIASALDNPKLKIVHADGAQYVKQFQDYFDVVIVDSSDPIGPNGVLFREEFYRDVRNVLRDDGIAVAQGECMWLHPKTIQRVLQMNTLIWDDVDYYWHTIPVYPSGNIGMLAMTKGKKFQVRNIARPEEAEELVRADNTKYYTPEIHAAAFVKPAFFYQHKSVLRERKVPHIAPPHSAENLAAEAALRS